jgi:Putative zinc dependent peptidase (DUF5700)
MIDAEGTLAFVSALEEQAPSSRIEALLQRPDLRLMFPAVGIPTAQGLALLEAIRDPARRESLDEDGRMIAGYLDDLVQHRNPFERLLQELQGRESELLHSAFEKTLEFLPGSCHLGTIRMVFLPIGYDFRTDEETVYIDPLAALQHGYEGIRKTLSHELHHIARYRLTGENITMMRQDKGQPTRSPHEMFREWATLLEMEGIADCIWNITDTDIPVLRPAVERRRQQMAQYQRLLGDALAPFHRMMTDSADGAPVPEALRVELLTIAHPVGARMAEAVLRDLDRPALIDAVGHPDHFLRRYNEVAKGQRLIEIDPRLVAWAERT